MLMNVRMNLSLITSVICIVTRDLAYNCPRNNNEISLKEFNYFFVIIEFQREANLIWF